jgi:7-keto-8-aminopelargonate synthetase-like enzyme
MFAFVDIIDVAGGSTPGFFASNLILIVVLFLFATTALAVTYPPAYLKKKFEELSTARGVLQGDDHRNLPPIGLAARYLKYKLNIPVKAGEHYNDSARQVAEHVLDTTDREYVDKYWAFAPGLTFDQRPDGIHVRVKDDEHDCLMMSSLSYWGFHVNKEIQEFAFQKVRETGTGNHGSYLLLGKNTVVEESYDAMSRFFKRKHCQFSASGFLACLNLVSFLANKGGIIFIDEKCHVCLRFGSKLGECKVVKFPHQNYNELGSIMEKQRHKYKGRALLVVDSIYSADGTIANLPRARALCDKYNVEIVMDEAHSLGTLGKTGHGVEEHFNMPGACDYICGVFSKTLSSYGGYVVSDREEVKLMTISPGIGFATGPHSFSAACVTKALEIIERDNGKTRAAVDETRLFYVNELTTIGKCHNIIHCGHNVFVSYPHTFAACVVAVEMRKLGFLISSFMFPSVPMDRSILRLTVHPLTTRENLTRFCETLFEVQTRLAKERFGDAIMFGPHNAAYYEEISHM